MPAWGWFKNCFRSQSAYFRGIAQGDSWFPTSLTNYFGESRLFRTFRFLEKKRGGRRTGSNWIGGISEALFCASLFLLGITSLAALVAAHFMYPDPAKYTAGYGFWVMVLVLASFVIMGGAGLIWTVLQLGISAERRSALTHQAANLDLFQSVIPQPEKYPTLPSHEGLTNSPGIDLAYRLPPSESPGWRLLAKTVFALLWNGLGCVLLVV